MTMDSPMLSFTVSAASLKKRDGVPGLRFKKNGGVFLTPPSHAFAGNQPPITALRASTIVW